VDLDADELTKGLSEAIRSIGEVIDPEAHAVRVRIAVEINRLGAQLQAIQDDMGRWVHAQLAQHQ